MNKKLKRILLYSIPLVLELIIHTLGGVFSIRASGSIPGRIPGAIIITWMAMVMGEGYGALVFLVAGCVEHIAAYIFVIIMSVVGIIASIVGFFISAIEGYESLWMTGAFCGIDLFLIVFSGIGIYKIAKK